MNHPLSQRFFQFAESECFDSSELYYHLSLKMAEDKELLELAESAKEGQPVPNLFFAAVHYLLDSAGDVPLANFYPSLSPVDASENNADSAFPSFRSFVLSRRESVAELLATRLVQTNEVRRCAYLFPAMAYAASWFSGREIALVEIGTSAGLNLLWDKYSYCYGESDDFGDANSPVQIRSEFRGEIPESVFDPLPQVSRRIGLDLNIVDTTNPDEAAWLRALIWPEHRERREILNAALCYRSCFKLDLRTGDGFSMITDVVNDIPDEHVVCVYHTHVANQISREQQEKFLAKIAEIGKSRDLIHIFNNIKPTLHLTLFQNGKEENIPLARSDGHARWFEWFPTRKDG